MQNTERERLIDCFEQVFPDLSRADVPACAQSTHATWDSIAHIMLMTRIGEEFGIDIDFEEFEDATSFEAVVRVVSEKKDHSQPNERRPGSV